MCLGEGRIIRNEASKQSLGTYGDMAACKKRPKWNSFVLQCC